MPIYIVKVPDLTGHVCLYALSYSLHVCLHVVHKRFGLLVLLHFVIPDRVVFLTRESEHLIARVY